MANVNVSKSNIAYTLGHSRNYDQALLDEPIVTKIGKTEDYEGGWVWSTPEAARDFLVSKEFLTLDWGDGKPRNPDNFSIYVLKLSNTWAEDVSEPDELGNKHLLHDAQILNKYNWRS